jgi:hypothetical protein
MILLGIIQFLKFIIFLLIVNFKIVARIYQIEDLNVFKDLVLSFIRERP